MGDILLRAVRVGRQLPLDIVLTCRILLRLFLEGDLSSRAVRATQVGDTEDGLPVAGTARSRARAAEAKASGRKSSLSPAVLDVSKVPVHCVGSCITVQLVSHVNESLRRSNINDVDARKVKNDGLERRAGILDILVSILGLRVVPSAVLVLLANSQQLTADIYVHQSCPKGCGLFGGSRGKWSP